jgi:hypothetical protein
LQIEEKIQKVDILSARQLSDTSGIMLVAISKKLPKAAHVIEDARQKG